MYLPIIYENPFCSIIIIVVVVVVCADRSWCRTERKKNKQKHLSTYAFVRKLFFFLFFPPHSYSIYLFAYYVITSEKTLVCWFFTWTISSRRTNIGTDVHTKTNTITVGRRRLHSGKSIEGAESTRTNTIRRISLQDRILESRSEVIEFRDETRRFAMDSNAVIPGKKN